MVETEEEQPIPGAPLVSIPGGTRWVKITNPHPGQVIKVRKTNDLSVFYSQEKPGQSQGRVNGMHRADRQSFLRDYEPYAKRDWVAAQRVLASLEHANGVHAEEDEQSESVAASIVASELEVVAEPALELDAETEAEVLGAVHQHRLALEEQIEVEDAAEAEAKAKDDLAAARTDIAQMLTELAEVEAATAATENATAALLSSAEERAAEGTAIPGYEGPLVETVVELQPAEEKPTPRRTRPGEINATEQEEILELWRSAESVDDIARTYNATTQTIYNVLDAQAHDEYALWRIVELVKRDGGGPIKAYKVSQWMHIPKDGVKDLCTSEAAQKVLSYTLVQRDPKRPWVETPMLELVRESEPEMATKPPTNNVVETPTEEIVEFDVLPVRHRRWQVTVLTTVTDTVEADNLLEAHAAALAKYPSGYSEVVGVNEVRNT